MCIRDRLTFVPPPLVALAMAAVPNAPPAWELYHYPTLLAAWLSLLFTALNLLPVGQLDGGHIVYALFGPRVHRVVARVVVVAMLLSGATAAVEAVSWIASPLPQIAALAVVGAMVAALAWGTMRRAGPALAVFAGVAVGVAAWRTLWPEGVPFAWLGWLVWAVLLVRVVRVDHPPVRVPNRLTPGQRVAAWLCLLAFALCVVPIPILGG